MSFKVLIVDDDPVNLSITENMLKGHFLSDSVASGIDAVKYLEHELPDLILMDIYMPGMNGYETAKAIRRDLRTAEIPIIMVSSDKETECELSCLNLGADDFITKPYRSEILISRIGRQISISKEKKELERKLQMLSVTAAQDALTGLWNRAYVENAINVAIGSAEQECGALIMIDIDNFGKFNNTFGHLAGDELLIKFASILKKVGGPGSIVSRTGGDEFIIFLKSCNNAEVVSRKLDRLFGDMNEELVVSIGQPSVTASVGVAFAPEDGSSFVSLYSEADKALYHIKENGKAAYFFA